MRAALNYVVCDLASVNPSHRPQQTHANEFELQLQAPANFVNAPADAHTALAYSQTSSGHHGHEFRDIGRAEAEGQLQQAGVVNGSHPYILRTKPGIMESAVFSYVANGKPIHHRIDRKPAGTYTVDNKRTRGRDANIVIAVLKRRIENKKNITLAPVVGEHAQATRQLVDVFPASSLEEYVSTAFISFHICFVHLDAGQHAGAC